MWGGGVRGGQRAGRVGRSQTGIRVVSVSVSVSESQPVPTSRLNQPGPSGTPQGWGLSQTPLRTAGPGASPRESGMGAE